MKMLLRQVVVGCLLLLGIYESVCGQTKTASVVGHCRSISVGPLTTFVSGDGTLTTYLTTYDGSSSLPLTEPIGGYISQEFRPRSGQPDVYEADYLVYSPAAVLLQYGWFALNFPPTDSDGNGMADIFQKDQNGSTSFTGNGGSDWPATTSFTLNGSISRAVGSQIGTVSATTISGTYSGPMRIVYLTGSSSYSRGTQNNISFNLTVNTVTASVNVSGSTTFTVLNSNQIQLQQFTATGDGATIVVYAATLDRSGNKYVGNLEIQDGEAATSWRDYKDWVLEVTDTNDYDGDGIPDLSDGLPVAPTISLHPQSRTVYAGATATFTVSVTGTDPFTYQWRKNNIDVPGATLASYTIVNTTASDAGNYSVRVSNTGGSTNSNSATLVVILMATASPSFATPTWSSPGGFNATLHGQAQTAYHIQWSTNLIHWLDLTNFVAGEISSLVTDPSAMTTKTRFYRAISLPMVLIPTGSFTMGDTFNEGNASELPTHSVTVSAFYVDRMEVTKALWDGVYQWAVTHGYSFEGVALGKAANHPVYNINWYDAVKWCNARSEKEGRVPAYYTSVAQTTVYRSGQVNIQNDWVKWDQGYRLPTEAEWEKAARGGLTAKRFSWVDADSTTHNRANYYSSSSYSYDVSATRGYHPTFNDGAQPYTSLVGSFAANGYGLYDMTGNVWEWCWDWYGSYSSDSQSCPLGPGSGSNRVLRGGAWDSQALHCRSAYRHVFHPASWSYSVGFRSVLPSSQP